MEISYISEAELNERIAEEESGVVVGFVVQAKCGNLYFRGIYDVSDEDFNFMQDLECFAGALQNDLGTLLTKLSQEHPELSEQINNLPFYLLKHFRTADERKAIYDWMMDWPGEEEIVEAAGFGEAWSNRFCSIKQYNDFNSFVDISSSKNTEEKLYRLVCEVMKRNPHELEGKEKKVWYLIASD